MNPFRPPELPWGRIGPLCPWQEPTHEEWYVDVDNTGRAFRDFQGQFGKIMETGGLEERGLLVVAHGESGCGKTSLLHRCARLVDDVTNQPGEDGPEPGDFIVDLTEYGYTIETSKNERLRLIEATRQVLKRLRNRRHFPVGDEHFEVRDPGDYHRAVYEWLAGQAERYRFTLVVLLPAVADFVNELREYSNLARECRRIVFLVESHEPEVKRFVEQSYDRNPLIGLDVSPINVGDLWLFIEERLRRHQPGQVAQTNREEADKAEEAFRTLGPVSIGRVVDALHKAWGGHDGPEPVGDLDALAIFKPHLQYLASLLPGFTSGGGHGG